MIIERRFNLFHYRFSFRTNDPRAAVLVSTLYTGREDSSSSPVEQVYELRHDAHGGSSAEWLIGVGGPATLVQPSLAEALTCIEASIAGQLARRDFGMHVIHGATVYAPEGDLLLTGESGAGKTTLSLALTARGLRVGGDDMATLDPVTNTVLPVPRCFHINERSAALLAQARVALPADALRDGFVTPAHLGVTKPTPARIRFVFILERERLAAPRIVPDTQAHAIATLLMQTGRGHFSDRQALDALSRLTGGCKCFRLWSASLLTTTDELAQLVRS